VLPDGLARLGPPIHPRPALHDALDMLGCAGAPHPEQPRFGLRGRHPRERPDHGIGQLPAAQGLGQPRQRPEGPGDTDPLPCRALVQAHPPAEPLGAGAESRIPPASGVELADEGEEARGGGIEVRGQLRDLVAEPVELDGGLGRGEHSGRVELHIEPSLC
jgi:hypothetical protein